MRFGLPLLLLVLLTFVPLIVALAALGRRQRTALRQMSNLAAIRRPGRRLRVVRMGLILTALALLGVAAARPQRGSRQEPAPDAGAEVVIALDASLSMLAADVAPNRFERAKAVTTALLDGLYGDRAGVVAFAGSAKLRFPLTTDITAAKQIVPTISIKEGGLDPSTGIGVGIREAVNLFPKDRPSRGRAVVLISDGEDLAGSALDGAVEARQQGVVLHTIGIGEEASVPIFVTGTGGRRQQLIDPTTGRPAETRREAGLLRDLARAGGGRYLDGNNNEAASILAGDLARLRGIERTSAEQTVPIERFQLVAAVALLLLFLSYLIPDAARSVTAPGTGNRSATGEQERGRKKAKRRGILGGLGAVFAVLALILGAACGGDGGKPATGSAGVESTRVPNPGTGARSTGQAGPELTRGLLRFEDMPAGWQFNAESAGSPENTEICGTTLAALEQHRQKLGEASIGFQRSESGPFFAETVAAYPAGVAERVMADLTAAVQSCREVTIRDDEGSLSTWQLTPLTFPQFGDQTLAFREYFPANGVEAIIVYVRRGDRIMVLLDIAINARVDRLQTEALVGRAYERFSQLGAGR